MKNMLLERLAKVKSSLEDLVSKKDPGVIIGQDYTEDNSDYDVERPDLGESYLPKDFCSTNGLDCDYEIEMGEIPFKEDLETSITIENPKSEFTTTSTLDIPTREQKEESMEALHKEDRSGNTNSFVYNFLEKYAEGNDVIQILRRDLMAVLSDMQWIIESDNKNEQFALDFADALNEISIKI